MPTFCVFGRNLLTHTSVAGLANLGANLGANTGAATGADRVPPLETIRTIAERVTRTRGLEVWDIQSRREQSGHVVRVVIDRPGPAATPEESVSVEDCAEVNRELSTILDVEDPLPFTYVLEVSSPGLDRPLREPADYERFAGRLAKLVVKEAVDNQKAFEGRLRGVERGTDTAAAGAPAGKAAGDGAIVLLEALNGRIHKLPLKLITRGRLEVEF